MQKFHKHRDENPNMGFVLVEESSPMLDSSRPCKSLVKLAHIIDRDRRSSFLWDNLSLMLFYCVLFKGWKIDGFSFLVSELLRWNHPLLHLSMYSLIAAPYLSRRQTRFC